MGRGKVAASPDIVYTSYVLLFLVGRYLRPHWQAALRENGTFGRGDTHDMGGLAEVFEIRQVRASPLVVGKLTKNTISLLFFHAMPSHSLFFFFSFLFPLQRERRRTISRDLQQKSRPERRRFDVGG